MQLSETDMDVLGSKSPLMMITGVVFARSTHSSTHNSATIVNKQLVCLLPVGDFSLVTVNLNIYYHIL